VVPCSDAPNLSVQFTPIANTGEDVTEVSVSSTESPTSADLEEGNPEASDPQVKVLSLQTIKDPSAELFAEMFLNTASNGEVDIPSVATKDAEMFESTEIEVEKPEVTSQTSKTSKTVNLEIENPAITVSDDVVPCSDAPNLSVQFTPIANTGEDVTEVSVSSTESPTSADLEEGNPEASDPQVKVLSLQTIKDPSAELFAEMFLNTASNGEVDIPSVATKDAEMFESTEIEVEKPEVTSQTSETSKIVNLEIENPAITVSDDAVLCSDALNLSVQFAPVANTGEDVTDVSVSSTKSPISSDLEGGNPEDSCLQFKALSSQTIKGPSAELPAEISLNTASIGEVDIPNVATKDAEMLESTEIEVENPETISHEALSSSVIDVSSSEGEVDLEDAVPNTISQVIETALSTETSIESSLVSFSDVKMLSPPSINLPSDEPSLELIPIPAADEECDMQEIEASTITASVSADLDIEDHVVSFQKSEVLSPPDHSIAAADLEIDTGDIVANISEASLSIEVEAKQSGVILPSFDVNMSSTEVCTEIDSITVDVDDPEVEAPTEKVLISTELQVGVVEVTLPNAKALSLPIAATPSADVIANGVSSSEIDAEINISKVETTKLETPAPTINATEVAVITLANSLPTEIQAENPNLEGPTIETSVSIGIEGETAKVSSPTDEVSLSPFLDVLTNEVSDDIASIPSEDVKVNIPELEALIIGESLVTNIEVDSPEVILPSTEVLVSSPDNLPNAAPCSEISVKPLTIPVGELKVDVIKSEVQTIESPSFTDEESGKPEIPSTTDKVPSLCSIEIPKTEVSNEALSFTAGGIEVDIPNVEVKTIEISSSREIDVERSDAISFAAVDKLSAPSIEGLSVEASVEPPSLPLANLDIDKQKVEQQSLEIPAIDFEVSPSTTEGLMTPTIDLQSAEVSTEFALLPENNLEICLSKVEVSASETSVSKEIDIEEADIDSSTAEVLLSSSIEVTTAELSADIASVPLSDKKFDTSKVEALVSKAYLPTSTEVEGSEANVSNAEVLLIPSIDLSNLQNPNKYTQIPKASLETDVAKFSTPTIEASLSKDIDVEIPDVIPLNADLILSSSVNVPTAEVSTDLFSRNAEDSRVDITDVSEQNIETSISTEFEVDMDDVTLPAFDMLAPTSIDEPSANLSVELPETEPGAEIQNTSTIREIRSLDAINMPASTSFNMPSLDKEVDIAGTISLELENPKLTEVAARDQIFEADISEGVLDASPLEVSLEANTVLEVSNSATELELSALPIIETQNDLVNERHLDSADLPNLDVDATPSFDIRKAPLAEADITPSASMILSADPQRDLQREELPSTATVMETSLPKLEETTIVDVLEMSTSLSETAAIEELPKNQTEKTAEPIKVESNEQTSAVLDVTPESVTSCELDSEVKMGILMSTANYDAGKENEIEEEININIDFNAEASTNDNCIVKEETPATEVSNRKENLCFHFLVKLIILTCLLFACISVNWYVGIGKFCSGLWRSCQDCSSSFLSEKLCSNVLVNDHVKIGRAFLLLAIIACIMSIFASIGKLYNKWCGEKIESCDCCLESLCEQTILGLNALIFVFTLVACCVMVAKMNSEKGEIGGAQIFGWVAVAISFLYAIVSIILWRKSKRTNYSIELS